jgi:hypothetical protein
MKPRVDMDISGQDIPCKSNQFCQVCGSIEDVKNACMQDNRCVGVTSVHIDSAVVDGRLLL